jgi:hypothetical protein
MKAPLLLILATFATTAAIADTPSAFSDRTDPQAQAAALLSPAYAPASATARSSQSPVESPNVDAHARAAALLSSQRTEDATTSVPVTHAAVAHVDAHEYAAMVLSGYRTH